MRRNGSDDSRRHSSSTSSTDVNCENTSIFLPFRCAHAVERGLEALSEHGAALARTARDVSYSRRLPTYLRITCGVH